MAPKLSYVFICLAFLSTPAFANTLAMGDVTMTTTVAPGSVTLDLEIQDDGGVPDCHYFLIRRYKSEFSGICHTGNSVPADAYGSIVDFFPRVIGTTITHQFVDTNVEDNAHYFYTLDASSYPPPLDFIPGCDHAQFKLAFGSVWDAEFMVPATTGPDDVLTYRGTLVGGDGFDEAGVYQCCFPVMRVSFLLPLPDWADPYVGQEVDIYGTYCCYVVQWGWSFNVTRIEPHPCATLAVEETTWGKVKSLYR